MAVASLLFACLSAASGLAGPAQVGAMLERIGDGDLALLASQPGVRPARVLLATRVATSPRTVQEIVASPGSYRKAMPSFRRIDVAARRLRGTGASDVQVAWELDVPLWNLKGRLWLRPRSDGADLVLEEGDLAPGLFHLTVWPDASEPAGSVFVVEGFANLAQANLAARELSKRSPLAEPAMTVAAAYVMLKSLARLAEAGSYGRPTATMAPPEFVKLDVARTGAAVLGLAPGRGLLAVVRSREDGRLAGVEVAALASPRTGQRVGGGLAPQVFRAVPGWKKIEVVSGQLDTCRDPEVACWAVEGNLPLFSLDGIWKIRSRPWRARLVAGQREGALIALDFIPGQPPGGPAVVLSEHPRLDRSGFIGRRLIAAEPYLEHGLALALALVDAASLLPALERD